LTGFLICAFAVMGTSTVAMAFNDDDETMETATEISMGDSLVGENELALDTSGKKESYDVDYYKFTLNKEQWVNLSITPHYDGLSYTVIGTDGYTQVAWNSALGPEEESVVSEKLEAGTYYVEIKATWPNRTGKYTIALSGKGVKFNKTPILFQAGTNTKRTKIKLSWDAVEEADGYVVYQYNKKSKKFKKIKTTKKTKATFTNLKVETEYKFRVTAYIKAGGKMVEGDPTEARSVYTNPKTPGSTKITSVAIGDKTTLDGAPVRAITVKWNKAKDATGYYVYGKIGDGEYKLLGSTDSNEAPLYAGVGFSYKMYVVPYRTKNGYTTKGDKSAVYTTSKINP